MKVPVLWVSRYTDILSRGYADQGFLEAVFAGEVWTPPGACTFEHYVDVGRPGSEWPDAFPDVDGAVVLLPARHHAQDVDVEWFLSQLDQLRWSVVILCGDEEWSFPSQRVEDSTFRRVWIMQPQERHGGLRGIPGGWYPGTREGTAPHGVDGERPLDWFFGGQVTHRRREECVEMLRNLRRPGRLIETKGYLQGVPQAEYLAFLSSSKVVPCPSGPCTVDTARPLEALEAGCVPVVDIVTPKGLIWDYWGAVFGPDCPLQRIGDWAAFPSMLDWLLEDWPAESNQVFAWWQGWKRDIVTTLHDDIWHASRAPVLWGASYDETITAIVTTSPAPLHPSTAHIEETVEAIRAQLPRAEIIIACDGVRTELSARRADYNEYLRRLLWLTNYRWHNVVPVLAPEWLHQAELTRLALTKVHTDLVLFVEHDRPPHGDIEWPELCSAVSLKAVDQIRLHPETSTHPDQALVMLDSEAQMIAGVPLRRTAAWWQHPMLVRAEWLREVLAEHFPPGCRTFIEDPLYGLIESDYFDHGRASWQRWKLAIYSPPGMLRSRHLDSRGDDPKLPIWMDEGVRT